MVHQVRFGIWAALAWIGAYLLLWSLPGLFAFGLLLTSLPWGCAALIGLMLGWVVHSRSYWSRLFNRSPQIELHPAFLRAKQLDYDILWKEVQDIRGSRYGTGLDPGCHRLHLTLVGGKCVELDLAAMDLGMEKLHRLACDAWQADAQRRQAGAALDAGHEAAPPPAPVATTGQGPGDLGEEIEGFGPRGGGVTLIVGGVAFLLGTSAFAFWLDPTIQTPVVPMMGGMGAIAFVALFLQGLKILRARLVLRQNGLTYVGLFRSYTVRYGDIQRMSVLSVRKAGLTEVTIELILRDGQVVKLSGLADGATAGQRIESLRSAADRHDRPLGAEQSTAAGTSWPWTSEGSVP
jgi:hypothetical protein